MNNKDDQYWEQIDDYLDGVLTGTEREAFKQRLTQETALAKDTLFQQEMRQGIAYGSQQELRSRLQHIHNETVDTGQEARVVPIGRQLWLRWSAAAALIVGALGILFWIQQTPSNEQLFADNYEVYEVDNISRSPGTEDSADLALKTYQSGNYSAAVDQLSRVVRNDPDNAPVQLALAISYWENDQPQQANSALKTLFSHPLLKDQAYWYAALYALAQEEEEEAINYLNKIATDSGQLYLKATKLQKRLTP